MYRWNYRVFQEQDGDYVIREVFYNDRGDIVGCTQEGVEPFGDSPEALRQCLEDFQAALDLPFLTLDDIPDDPEPSATIDLSRTTTHEQLLAEFGLRRSPFCTK